jgi:hypothetical protein
MEHGEHGKVHEYYFDGENLKVDICDERIIFKASKAIAWQPLPNKYLR